MLSNKSVLNADILALCELGIFELQLCNLHVFSTNWLLSDVFAIVGYLPCYKHNILLLF